MMVIESVIAIGLMGLSPHLCAIFDNSNVPILAIKAVRIENQGDPIHIIVNNMGMIIAADISL